MQNFITKLKASFSLLLLFGEGINAFTGERKAAITSFIIPLLMSPVTLLFVAAYPPRSMQTGFTMMEILEITFVRASISFLLYIAYISLVAWVFQRSVEKWKFFEALNWASLAAFIVVLPFTVMAVMGWLPRDEMDRLLVILALYTYLVAAHIANRTFRLNWQLAGFIGVLVFFSDQHGWDIVDSIWNLPEPWDI